MSKESICWKDVIFTCDEYYTINEFGVVTSDDSRKLPVEYVTLSNGLDYVYLRNNKNKRQHYLLDYIMAWTFMNKEVVSNMVYDMFNNPRFEVEHLDGNIHNHNLSNLRVCKPHETWIPLIYPDNVIKGKYSISTFGRVRSNESGRFLKPNNLQYPYVSIYNTKPNGEITSSPMLLHRLLALHFVHNPDPDALKYVDHIDGNKYNCTLENLHWVTSKTNAQLASASGLANSSNVSTDAIDTIIMLLLKFNGSIKQVNESIDHDRFPNMTEAVINNIKHHDPAYIRSDGKYDLKNIEFEKRTRKADLTDDEIEEICKALVECKFDIGATLNLLHFNGLEHIARHDIRHIRDKSKRCDISDKYFSRDDYEHPKKPMTDDVVELVCKALVKHNGNIAKATKEMNENGHLEINKYQVQDIKYKKRGCLISDGYFTYDDKEFKPI